MTILCVRVCKHKSLLQKKNPYKTQCDNNVHVQYIVQYYKIKTKIVENNKNMNKRYKKVQFFYMFIGKRFDRIT